MKSHVIVFALLAMPMIAVAQSNETHRCTMGDLVRRVSIEREGSAPVPCEVAYYKDTEAAGQRQVLWNAQNDAGYCEARRDEFVSQLEGWGWQCVAASAAPAGAGNEND
jgi:hypothetical protein